jgi:hypothetical protein
VTKIAAAAMGRVKVRGKATGPYTLLSPLAQVDATGRLLIDPRAPNWSGLMSMTKRSPLILCRSARGVFCAGMVSPQAERQP